MKYYFERKKMEKLPKLHNHLEEILFRYFVFRKPIDIVQLRLKTCSP